MRGARARGIAMWPACPSRTRGRTSRMTLTSLRRRAISRIGGRRCARQGAQGRPRRRRGVDVAIESRADGRNGVGRPSVDVRRLVERLRLGRCTGHPPPPAPSSLCQAAADCHSGSGASIGAGRGIWHGAMRWARVRQLLGRRVTSVHLKPEPVMARPQLVASRLTLHGTQRSLPDCGRHVGGIAWYRGAFRSTVGLHTVSNRLVASSSDRRRTARRHLPALLAFESP